MDRRVLVCALALVWFSLSRSVFIVVDIITVRLLCQWRIPRFRHVGRLLKLLDIKAHLLAVRRVTARTQSHCSCSDLHVVLCVSAP